MAAVSAAVTLPFHSGRTEGVNTRMSKMIKRQMYGRAGVHPPFTASSSADATNRHHRKRDRAVEITVPEIKNRGTRDVLMVVCDGLKGLPDAIAQVWPAAITQTCVVHYSDIVVMPIRGRWRWLAGVSGLVVSA